MSRWMAYALLVAMVMTACGNERASKLSDTPDGGGPMALSIRVTSSAFDNGQQIPKRYTCDGENIPVPLAWDDVPVTTKSIALIVDDPDAPMGTYVHWVLYNLPASARSLSEGVSSAATLPDGSRNGRNSSRQLGYMGPCPPSGTHRYFFKLYALDMLLTLDAGATKEQLLEAMQGHILAQGELIGTYKR